ncbi:hypothetical protein JOC86_004052 [Bacillus pakistanensis]|uniref:Uncharacterized protein n=1 Tax=Rossellomorea pakistanensis TaxID=992288 RepID=A0ABS2NI75_9BACI|nr:hypothetical protein [Bacillus pakistanensis]MBM7587479.1 hypothetical protein [Bacillus pakistanensis]
MNKKQTENKPKRNFKKSEDNLYGIDAETSLQSVHFATTENSYLNEHFQEESDN